GTKGWIVYLTNTTAVFDPTEKDKLVERWLGGKSTFRIILASKRKISKFRMLFEAFKDEIITFDREIRIVYGKDEMGYYRVPIILNVYRGDENKAQSVCIAYNARKDEVQQIKFAKTELHSVEEECKEIIIRYFIKDRRILPSEQGVVRKLF
ncbi:TPA: hypothetical protein H1009_01965, partial [archaeon]|nr:hypothetical protein [Candidatus Naiadarchaeales archaeon SRR2090153.bin461]